MTTEKHERTIDDDQGPSSWLYDHIGRLTGLGLGLLVLIGLLWLAAIGFTPALAIIVFFVSGILLIIGGGKIHRA